MRALYSDGPVHSFDPREASALPGVFVVARVDGKAVGCGAVRPLDGPVGEVKRVFVRPEFRLKGIAARIMTLLEKKSLQNGFKTLRLETGTKQPEAIALYEALGYRKIPGSGSTCPTHTVFATKRICRRSSALNGLPDERRRRMRGRFATTPALNHRRLLAIHSSSSSRTGKRANRTKAKKEFRFTMEPKR
jgi:N-acetylglutamate synthase-like GNAT family acetyltransferase